MRGIVMGGKSAGEPTWHTSERCDGGACVEIGTTGEVVLIRSSKAPDGKYVTLTRDEWQMFVAGVKDGDFDSV
jgi:predicted secreted Zn-dependent protease